MSADSFLKTLLADNLLLCYIALGLHTAWTIAMTDHRHVMVYACKHAILCDACLETTVLFKIFHFGASQRVGILSPLCWNSA